MRLFDENNEKSLNNISLFLTIDEAKELLDSLEGLLKNFKNDADHTHINDENYKREITVCLYNETNLNGWNETAKKLILEDDE